MKIVMAFEYVSKAKPPTQSQIRAFDLVGRVPLLGEHVRFGGADHEILSVTTDLDDGVIVVGISEPK